MPECTALLGSRQVPPTFGVPPKALKRLKLPSVVQSVMLPLVPAFGRWRTVMVRVALALAQGPVPATV